MKKLLVCSLMVFSITVVGVDTMIGTTLAFEGWPTGNLPSDAIDVWTRGEGLPHAGQFSSWGDSTLPDALYVPSFTEAFSRQTEGTVEIILPFFPNPPVTSEMPGFPQSQLMGPREQDMIIYHPDERFYPDQRVTGPALFFPAVGE